MEAEHGNSGKELLIEKLRAMLILEADKPRDEMDTDFVAECADYLMELENTERLTELEIRRAVAEIMKMYDRRKRKKRRLFSTILVAAILISTLCVFASSQYTYDPGGVLKVIDMYRDEYLELPFNELINFHGVEIFKEDNVTRFDSYEDYLESTDEKILYPSELPQDVKAAFVQLTDSSNDGRAIDPDYKDIHFYTNNPYVCMTIHTNPNMEWTFTEYGRKETIAGFECYVSVSEHPEHGMADCHFIYGDYVYKVQAKTYEDMKYMVESLKENAQ